MLEENIETFLKEQGIEVADKASSEYRKLCVEIHKAETKPLPLHQLHMRCNFT